jgi:hypothetical protein
MSGRVTVRYRREPIMLLYSPSGQQPHHLHLDPLT